MSISNNAPRDAEEYLAQLNSLAATVVPASKDPVTQDNAGYLRDLIGKIDRVAKDAECDRKAMKEPYLELGRKIDDSFRVVANRSVELVTPLKKSLAAFLAAEDKRKREEADRARKEADMAAKAAVALKDDAFVSDYASQQAEEKARAARYAKLLAQQNTIKGETPGRAVSLRTYRVANIVNPALLVGHFASEPSVIAQCEKLANAQIRAAKGAPVNIPGIEVVEEKGIA